mmetsp:Transcript_38278/g.98630  ORF Transcript_38278/g.98630 Transcript_38278/m.98630 type:complete len:101 (-) Transcript_38278:123-425(-)
MLSSYLCLLSPFPLLRSYLFSSVFHRLSSRLFPFLSVGQLDKAGGRRQEVQSKIERTRRQGRAQSDRRLESRRGEKERREERKEKKYDCFTLPTALYPSV